MTRTAVGICLAALGLLVAVQPATGRLGVMASAQPCSESTVGGATVFNYCGSAKATVKLAGKTLAFKGGGCGLQKSSLLKGWALGIGRYTVPPATAKFKYFGVAYVGTPKAGTFKKGEFVITFSVPGKTYSVIGSPLGTPAMTVAVTKGARKGTFSGVASGKKVSGQWTC